MDREKVIQALDDSLKNQHCGFVDGIGNVYAVSEETINDALELLKERETVVHPEPSCEMTYITDCCCDLCGVQLIREDNFCRGCGRPIVWQVKWE